VRRAIAVAVLCTLVAGPGCTRRIRVTPFEIDGHPSAITVVGDHVWVADDVNHAVHVLDARTGKASGERIEVGRNPVALAAGGGSVWVAHASGRVTAIDARTRDVRDRRVGGSLTGVAFAARPWVTDLEDGELISLDPDTLKADERVRIPDGAVRVAAGPSGALWVTNDEDTVTRVVEGRVAGVRHVGLGPIGLASDGRRTVWVANSDDDTVSVLRGVEGEPSAPVAVGEAPVAVAVVGGNAWSVDQDGGTLTPLARPDGPPIELGTMPRGAVGVEWFGHEEIWVVGSNPDRVVRVQL
jgi:DNA-binding beta-propeller fold protein YncE